MRVEVGGRLNSRRKKDMVLANCRVVVTVSAVKYGEIKEQVLVHLKNTRIQNEIVNVYRKGCDKGN